MTMRVDGLGRSAVHEFSDLDNMIHVEFEGT